MKVKIIHFFSPLLVFLIASCNSGGSTDDSASSLSFDDSSSDSTGKTGEKATISVRNQNATVMFENDQDSFYVGDIVRFQVNPFDNYTLLSVVANSAEIAKETSGSYSYHFVAVKENELIIDTAPTSSLVSSYHLGLDNAFIDGEAETLLVNLGEDYVLPTALCEGYRFEGWYLTSDFSRDVIKTVSASNKGALTFYAKFTPATAKVIFFSGQSNAVGYSWYENLKFRNLISEGEYQKYVDGYKNAQIYCFNDAETGSGYQTYDFEDIRFGQGNNTRRFGAEVTIAETFKKIYPNEIIYIIKMARGGARLKDQFFSPSSFIFGGPLYYQMIARFDKGLKILEDRGLTPEVLSFLWIQGENDASFGYGYDYYRLQANLFDDIRDRYVDYASSNGISVVQVGVPSYFSNHDIVNNAKQEYANNSNIAYFVPATNYHTNQEGQPDPITGVMGNIDNYHYDSESMLQLGRDVGAILVNIMKEAPKEVTNPDYHQFRTTLKSADDIFEKHSKVFSGSGLIKSIDAGKESKYLVAEVRKAYSSGGTRWTDFAVSLDGTSGYADDKYVKFEYTMLGRSATLVTNGNAEWTDFGSEAKGIYMTIPDGFPEEGEVVSIYFAIDVTKYGLTQPAKSIGISDGVDSSCDYTPATFKKLTLDGDYYVYDGSPYVPSSTDPSQNSGLPIKNALSNTPYILYSAKTSYKGIALKQDNEHIYIKVKRSISGACAINILINDYGIEGYFYSGDNNFYVSVGRLLGGSNIDKNERITSFCSIYKDSDADGYYFYLRLSKAGISASSVGTFDPNVIYVYDVNANWLNGDSANYFRVVSTGGDYARG